MKKKNYFWTIVLAVVFSVWFIGLTGEHEFLPEIEDVSKISEYESSECLSRASAEFFAKLQDSCDVLNAKFAVDSFKVVNQAVFKFKNDTIIGYEIFFKEGGSCKGESRAADKPSERIAAGDSVIYKKYYVVNFNDASGEGAIGRFEGVACWDEENRCYCWL